MDEPHKSIAVAVLSLCRARDEIRARMRALENTDVSDKQWNDLNDAAAYMDSRAYQLTAYGKRLMKKGI